MTYPSGQTNSGPPRRCTGGGGGGGAAPLSLEGAENYDIVFVDKTTSVYVADGSVQYPYNTIAAGLVAAAALLPTASKPVLVYVMPGVYDEQVTLSVDYVYLAGWDRDTTIITNVLTSLTVNTQRTAVANLTITSTAPGVIRVVDIVSLAGAWTEAPQFVDCKFDVPVNCLFFANASTRVNVRRCSFISGGGSQFIRCDGIQHDFCDCETLIRTQIGSGAIVVFSRCRLGGVIAFSSTTSLYMYDCYSDSGGFEAVLFSTAVFSNLVLKGNRLVSSATYDVHCAVAATGAVIENNVMTRGISPNVSHVNPVKYVGSAGHKDFYNTTQDALTACTYDDCVVKLLKDEVLAAALTFNVARIVTIDGNGKHTISRPASTILNLAGTAGRKMTFRDIILAGATSVAQNGSGEIKFEDVHFTGQFYIVSGLVTDRITFEGSTLLGDATFTMPILVGSDIVIVTFKRCRVKGGAAGNPAALYWFAGTVGGTNVKMERSTFVHGFGGANDPFRRDAAQTPTFAAHHCAFNTIPGAGWATNAIPPAQQFNTTDPNVDF